MKILIDEDRVIHPLLEEMKGVAKGVYMMMGSRAEVILHDLSNPESSLVFIAGEVTNRQLGAPATDVMLKALRNKNPEDILNYQTKSKDGHTYKSSTMFIRDENSKVIGCMGINYDVTDMLLAGNIINEFCSMSLNNNSEPEDETFANTVNEILKEMLEKSKEQIGKPVPFMNKDDKLKVIKFLDQRGAFMIKGAVEEVADDLRVSRYTIYNYLKEIDYNDERK